MGELRKIMVDDHGNPLDGTELFTATPQAVKDGLLINEPVILCYPSGREVRGHEARLTAKGLAVAAQEMGRGEPRH